MKLNIQLALSLALIALIGCGESKDIDKPIGNIISGPYEGCTIYADSKPGMDTGNLEISVKGLDCRGVENVAKLEGKT